MFICFCKVWIVPLQVENEPKEKKKNTKQLAARKCLFFVFAIMSMIHNSFKMSETLEKP